jgi:hypothetical protein
MGIMTGLSSPHALGMFKNELYAGFYLMTWPQDDSILFRFDGAAWHEVPGLDGEVMAFNTYNNDLYIGGAFTMAGSDSAVGIVKYIPAPNTNCNWLQPRVQAVNDTFYLSGGQAQVQFYNNNAYAQSWSWDFGDGGTASIKTPLHVFTNDSTYLVSITVEQNGCTKTANRTITILSGSGLEEYSKSNISFKLYPNPTSGDITAECTLPEGKPA